MISLALRYRYVSMAVAIITAFLLPFLANAQNFGEGELGYIGNFFREAIDLINGVLIPLLFALLVLGFFWGVFTYFILGGSDEGEREKGRKLMLYAIIGFVVVVSLYGIITVLMNAFGISTTGSIDIPVGPSAR